MTDRVLRAAARIEELARRRSVQAILLAALCLYGARHVSRSMGDFVTYHRAAERLLAHEPVYRLSDPHRYLYAPIVVFLFAPIAPLPPLLGKILWFAANLLLVVSILRMTAAMLFPEGRAPPGFYALVLLLSFRFIDNNLGHGQVNLLLLWLVLAAYALAARGRTALAGAALALAIVTKIVPAVLLLELVLRRRWRFAAATVLATIVAMAAPALWWGAAYPQILSDWVAVVRDQAGHYAIGNKINQSIAAFAHRLLRPHLGGLALSEPDPLLETVVSVALHAGFLIPLVLFSLRLGPPASAAPDAAARRRECDELSLYLLYSTVLSPYSWKYYFANLIVPVGAAAARLWTDERGRVERPLFAVFLLNLLPGLRLFGKHVATLFQLWSFHFLSVVVLFVLLARLGMQYRSTFHPSKRVC